MRFDDTCPDDWAFRSIESRCSKITSGGTPSRATPSFYVGNGGIPWVKTKELNNWFIEDTEEHISDEAIRSSSAKMLPKSSVLIAMYGATVGELGILAAPMACNQACCALIVNQDTDDERFLFYQLLSRKQDIKNQAVGAAQQNISAQFVRSIELPTPPKAEQKAIAHILGTLDDKIELNRKTNETLEAVAKALFKSWFVDFDPVRAKAEGRPTGLPAEISDLFPDSFEDSELGEVPSGWGVVQLGEVIELAYGKPLKEEQRNGGVYSVFGSNGVVGSHDDYLVEAPGIVVGRKGNPGTVEWSETNFYPIDTTFFVVNKKGDLGMRFLFYSLKNQNLAHLSADSAVPGLNRNHAYLNAQMLPPVEVAAAFESYSEVIFKRKAVIADEVIALGAARDALLPKLISGEIRIPDAEKMLEEVGI
jgi:type I restriction enzyme S subunit